MSRCQTLLPLLLLLLFGIITGGCRCHGAINKKDRERREGGSKRQRERRERAFCGEESLPRHASSELCLLFWGFALRGCAFYEHVFK